MKGDFSRLTGRSAANRHYNAVLKQQGRVQLDSDWNEHISIIDHQRKTRTIDIIGHSGAPIHDSGFQIIHPGNGPGDLLFSSGRYYVDGLLVETSPSSKLPIRAFSANNRIEVDDTKVDGIKLVSGQWVRIFSEEDQQGLIAKITGLGTNWIEVNEDLSSLLFDTYPKLKLLLPYSDQPDHPNAVSYEPVAGQTDLIYLDVWERHITAIEDPNLREVALGGPDTDTRIKTIAQVKILQNVGTTNCDEEISQWDDLITPPNGRLTTKLVVPDDPLSPCELGESGGFHGMENRLYRVEIHDVGTDGNPTFKWSRDNAAYAYAIKEFFDETGGVVNKIRLKQNGKDEILKIKAQDWIEVSGDYSDLDTDNPGTLIQVQKVDGNIITLDGDVSGHIDEPFVKIRRWDTSNQRPEALTEVVEGTGFQLEDGIEIEFTGTVFKTGDFWVFSARTLTGEIEILDREMPLGIQHHYSRLALVTGLPEGSVQIEDCRKEFYPLTELSPGDDLRLHHKYLHGFGVVCGLKVICGTDRRGVTIQKGVALDCEGYMIRVTSPINYPLVDIAENQGFLDSGNDSGNSNILCLSIANGLNNNPVISLEPYNPQKFWDKVLEGTLIKDFYEECILTLVNFFRDQFPTSFTDEAPVPVQQRRLTAFINLLFQLVNPESGSFGFISGGSDAPNPDEDQLLRDFYAELKEIIASDTFCAMHDDRTFPDYLIDSGLSTIFGPTVKFHHRLRIAPSGTYAYTCGNNNMVYVYHLEEQEMVQSTAFPSNDNIILQDIAITGDGSRLITVGIVDNTHSSFAIAQIEADGRLIWESPTTIQHMKFVSLGVGRSLDMYSIAKGSGLFNISGIVEGDFNPDRDMLQGFNATGLLHVASEFTEQDVIYAAANRSTINETSFFDHVVVFSPTPSNSAFRAINAQGEDEANDITTLGNRVFITSSEPDGNNRILGEYHPNEPGMVRQAIIGPDSSARTKLAAYSDITENGQGEEFMLITISDQFKVVRVPMNRDIFEPDPTFRIPVQLFPMSIALDQQRSQGYVLNSVVNTLTKMDLRQVFQANPAPDYTMEPPENLRFYRNEALEVYHDLLYNLVQHIKDCFCDKYLVKCPECEEEDKVYLGCIEIRNSEIYHICNFSKRKYVKSFPTVEYWLSTIPVIPLIREAFTIFCCTVIDRQKFRQ